MNDNRSIVRAFYERMNRLDAAGMMALTAPDATWWIPTDKIGGLIHTREAMAAILPAMFSVYSQGPEMRLGRLVTEGETVCAEVTARGGRTKGGYQYENDYLMLFTIRNQLIVEVREYLNPSFVDPLAAEVAAASRPTGAKAS